MRTTCGVGGYFRAAFRADEGILRAADRALHGIFAGGGAAFRADGLSAVGTAIGAIGQLGAALRAFAGEIEPAVGTDFRIGADFGAAPGASENRDRQFGATVNTHAFIF